MTADTVILGAILALEVIRSVQEWRVDQEILAEHKPATAPAPAPVAAPASVTEPEFTAEDLRIERLIQQVDPSWRLGDTRDHINFVTDEDGRIVRAVLA